MDEHAKTDATDAKVGRLGRWLGLASSVVILLVLVLRNRSNTADDTNWAVVAVGLIGSCVLVALLTIRGVRNENKKHAQAPGRTEQTSSPD